MKRLFTILAILGLVACGKQGPPRPPVLSRPAPAADLLVAQRGPTVILTWTYPAMTTTGRSLDRLDRLVVYRVREQLPPALDESNAVEVNTAGGTAVPRAIELFSRVPPISTQQFKALAEKLGELSKEQIPSFTAGAMVVVEDRPPIRTETGRPYRYTYGVTAVSGRTESEMSNLVSIVPIDVPLPPDQPTIEATAAGVNLDWDPPVRTILGDDPNIEGYNIYRLPITGGSSLTARPINASPIDATDYVDTPPYGSWRYAVTTVRHAGPPVHESQFPLVSSIEFSDLQPPPVPAELSTLVEERVIRLIWPGVDAPDLAGYRVYRRIPGEPRRELTTEPVTRTIFIDELPEPGVEYLYEVTSVDRSGNQSEPVMAQPVLIPR